MSALPGSANARLETRRAFGLGIDTKERVVALAGNPNTGKSTVFNALTGLHQHTGNWPGKTVTRAQGGFAHGEHRYRLVDLPGTYSLLAMSPDEEIARNFILFARPDVTVVVVDAGRLERNLNLVLQVAEITDRMIVCLNLMDEAERHGIDIDTEGLGRELGVPVVATSATSRRGLPELVETIAAVANGRVIPNPRRVQKLSSILNSVVDPLISALERSHPDLPNPRWVALRLLEGDDRIIRALQTGELGSPSPTDGAVRLLADAESSRFRMTGDPHQQLMEATFAEAERVSHAVVSRRRATDRIDVERRIDRLITSRVIGFPLMLVLFTLVFWITIEGANIPSQWLAWLLIDQGHVWLSTMAVATGMPPWLSGVLIDGVYLATAWVVSVMLPPMAIFFPLFTLLEDSGYLPRVAFNLDSGFRRCGAHGKQALCMMMGYGCNAAGIVSTRIIDSPRERMIAMLTNNFALCNGRWPTMILVAGIFIGTQVPKPFAALIAALTVVGVALLGVFLALGSSWVLSRTLLKGHVSTFSLELPPYRRPKILMTLYTSLIDRTLFVLWRAVVFAAPAGAVIWLVANVRVGEATVAGHIIQSLDPLGVAIGLNGIILLAYVIAIPANEIVIPTILMLTVLVTGATGVGEGAGVMFELESRTDTLNVLHAGGWTLLTGINLMLFSLAHNPCGTTLYTMYRETGSARWTALAAIFPVIIGLALTFSVASVWRLFGTAP